MRTWAALLAATVVIAGIGAYISTHQDETATAAAARPQPARVSGPVEQQLAGLKVAANGSMRGYSENQFPHWTNQGHSCDTREVVLNRQGQHVTDRKDCYPATGTWHSPYDGQTWTKASDVDIDHVVPRANAWISGASAWKLSQRTAFANDLVHPELIAVTDNLNSAKGDKSPDQWKPPLSSYWCTYASDYVAVKHQWHLTITQPEHDALAHMLTTCR